MLALDLSSPARSVHAAFHVAEAHDVDPDAESADQHKPDCSAYDIQLEPGWDQKADRDEMESSKNREQKSCRDPQDGNSQPVVEIVSIETHVAPVQSGETIRAY